MQNGEHSSTGEQMAMTCVTRICLTSMSNVSVTIPRGGKVVGKGKNRRRLETTIQIGPHSVPLTCVGEHIALDIGRDTVQTGTLKIFRSSGKGQGISAQFTPADGPTEPQARLVVLGSRQKKPRPDQISSVFVGKGRLLLVSLEAGKQALAA